MANPAPTINQINAFNATQGTTIDFNIIGGTELIRSNRIYIYDLSDNSLICTHLYVSTESIHELPANTDGSIVYESGKSSADFVNGAQYYAQIQTYTDTAGTQGGSGLSVAKMFWCLVDPTLTITTIPSTISTTSYNISATYTDTSASVVSNIIQQYQFNLYSATGSLLQSSGVVVGSGTQQGTSDVYDISYNFTGLNVGSSYYVTVNVTTTQGMSVTTQSNTFTVSIDTPTLGEATVVNNACDGYISVTSNLSGEYGGSGSGEIVSFETDSEDVFSKLQVELEPTQEGSGTPSPSNVRPIRGHSGVDVNVVGKNLFDDATAGLSTLYWTQNGHVFSTDRSNATYIYKEVLLHAGTEYTLSTNIVSISNDSVKIQFRYNGNIVAGGYPYYTTLGIHSVSYTPIQDGIYRVLVGGNSQGAITLSNIQLEEGSTATPYEPYNAQTITQDFNATLTPTSTDTTPYLFKAVGDVYGDRLEDKIVGGTVAWNQLVQDGNFTDASSWATSNATMTVSNNIGTVTQNNNSGYINKVVNTVSGHRCLAMLDIKGVAGKTYTFNGVLANLVADGTWQTRMGMFTASVARTYLVISQKGEDGFPAEWQIRNACIFDLTQMFGSTIADYIYSLEQSQAGAGVAWFKKLFPKDYYAYNAGELLSVEGLQSHDTVGFNQWDEEWELGTYNELTGKPANSSSMIRSKVDKPIRVMPNTNYYMFAPAGSFMLFYDESDAFINYKALSSNSLFVTPPNAAYVRFRLSASYGTTYNHDICINLSNPSRNGEYEPYEKHSYPLDSSLTLRGIPKLDASNNLYYDGDEYTSDGKVKRKYGVSTPTTATLEKDDHYTNLLGVPCWSFKMPSDMKGYGSWYRKNAIADKVVVRKYANGVTNCIITDATTTNFVYASSTGVTVEQATDFIRSLTFVYELATPTTETATPYTNPQIVSKYGTLEYVTNSIVPVGHKTTYLTRDIFGGYVDLISGKLVVDKVSVDLGSLEWANYKTGGFRTPRIPNMVTYTTETDGAICEEYNRRASTVTLSSGEFCIESSRIYIVDSAFPTDATAFKAAMNGVQLVYELATPQTYQLTPQQVNTLVGTNNVWSEQGSVELSYHIPITNLLVKRQDVDDVSGGWLTLYSQPISQASDMDFTFIDFLNQYGKTYKYALVPLLTQTQSGVEVEVEGGYTVSNEVQSVFDGVFIADSTGSQKCKANVGYGNVDMNQVVGSITPIGAKYPIIITNSHNQYHNGSISGTIVPDDYYFNGNLSRIDMVNKRNELEQFLTNKRVKVIKDWNGNIWLVMIAGNVSCTFNNNYGMGIVSFSTNWTEVGDPTNQQDLQATGLINVGGV